MSRLTFSALMATCLFSASAPAQLPVVESSPAVKLTASANNDFACDLYRKLAKDKDNADKNLFVSPWSINSALAMTMEGARNDTAAEMGQVLRLPKELRQAGERPWKLDSYHAGFAELQRRCTGQVDAKKDQADRAKLAALRKELEGLNDKIKKERGKEPPDVVTKAHLVAAEINRLQREIDRVELHVANAIWGEQTYPFDPAFFDRVAAHYGTGVVRQADFINNFPGERLKINRWVEDQTKERIKDLIPEMKKEEGAVVRMILVNAIYFKGQWSEPFQKRWTKQEPFLCADGTKRDAAFMHSPLLARYAAFHGDGAIFATPRSFLDVKKDEKTYPDADGFLIAELPYKGGKLAMVVLVPQSRLGLPALEAKLTGETLTRWLGRLEGRSIQMTMPKFKMETRFELGKTLADLGMPLAFDEGKADFSGMSRSSDPNDNLYISRVIHKAFVEVNEEGTEAAAATAVLMSVVPVSAPPPPPFIPVVRADRPFLFLIREVETGAVLFMGRMTTPSK